MEIAAAINNGRLPQAIDGLEGDAAMLLGPGFAAGHGLRAWISTWRKKPLLGQRI